MSAQQTKANVLIYTQTNRSFIEQKVYDYFKYQCLKDDQLKDLDTQKMLKVLKQIYDFGQHNMYMKKFFALAIGNMQKFINEQYKETNQTVDLVIDIGKLLDVIFYCIEHGFVEEPKQERKHKQPIQKQKPEKKQINLYNKQVKQQKKQQKNQTIQPEKVKKFYVAKPKTPQKKNFIEKYQMPQKKMPPRYLMHMAKQIKKQQQVPVQSDVQPLDYAYIQKNKHLIQMRLEDLYKHYCSQQQNLGQHATFDRIKQECSQMTVGKFLLFCKISKVFDDKQITKDILIAKFKKIVQGKKEIRFDQFKQLLTLVDQQYIKIKKEKSGEGYIIPTYEARLKLQGYQYKKHKKDVDLPFYTKQKQGRELKKFSTIEDSRYKHKDELTSHSGKFGKDLRQQMQRKLASQSSSFKKKNNDNPNKAYSNSKIVRLDKIRHQSFAGMQWVLQEDESDTTFMKQYKNRDIVGQIKKRVNDLQKLQKTKI